MCYRLAAEVVLLLHLAFIVFVVFGAAMQLRFRWSPVIHLPAAIWGIIVELTGRSCPVTLLENYLRNKGGQLGYPESFIEHYLLAIIYPDGLTREVQFALATLVAIINVAIYGWIFWRRR